MKVGKLSGKLLKKMVLSTIQFQREDVLVHAGLGEDCAVIDFGDQVCLISSDPITGAFEGIGELAVHVACNDIAANGGSPIGVQIVLLLPEHIHEGKITEIMTDIQITASKLGVEVIGGHTEITDKVRECVVVATAVGRAPKDGYITSRGAKIGDSLVISKGVGIEATTILSRDFPHRLPFSISDAEISDFTEKLSVVPEGLIGAGFGVNAMHDITEGGLLGATREICHAANVGALIWEREVYVPELTARICNHLALDPLALLSSGSMLMVTSDGEGLVRKLEKDNIQAFIVGKITDGTELIVQRETGEMEAVGEHVEDELWRFFAEVDSIE
ncbi:MAG: AIR synthase family protein [Bacillota bacterium]|nr:AIR synthase family protein [Bacillota bacterium]HHU61432.1 AIR synthase [Natronincola sp.]